MRYPQNPLITYKDIPGAIQVYNPGAVKSNGEYILLLTVLTDGPTPCLHVARSEDGINFSIELEPFITADSNEAWICDPRITRIDDIYYIIYWSGDKFGARSVLATTEDFKTIKRHGYICEADNRNITLFPEKINGLYARLDRPYGASHSGSIWLSYSPDLIFWGKSRPVADKGNMFQWEGNKIGPGAPPIKTEKGWLHIYHGVRGGYHGYYLGCMLLDLEDPSKIIGRIKNAILSPCEDYERVGAVANVVFCCGLTEEKHGQLNIYYAGADTCICLATAYTDQLVDKCIADGP
jgi:predicted GH43/DUF377 family glycosyl hydrolase